MYLLFFSCYRKVRSAFVKRYDSPLGWSSIATSLLTTVALLIAQLYLAAISLAAILSLDLFVVIRENNLRRTEVYRKTRMILEDLRLAERELCSEWQACNYPHNCCPLSPCVSLQWTYRDGVIVNLPWALLVKGDYIVMRPGHVTPGPCTEVNGKRSFNTLEIYGVSQNEPPPAPVKPIARNPFPDIVCCLETTPYLSNLKLILENCSKRPPTIYNQQRYLVRIFIFILCPCPEILICNLGFFSVGHKVYTTMGIYMRHKYNTFCRYFKASWFWFVIGKSSS